MQCQDINLVACEIRATTHRRALRRLLTIQKPFVDISGDDLLTTIRTPPKRLPRCSHE
jgi:hypothetical protein